MAKKVYCGIRVLYANFGAIFVLGTIEAHEKIRIFHSGARVNFYRISTRNHRCKATLIWGRGGRPQTKENFFKK